MPIKVENLVHIYSKDTVFQHVALDYVSLTIEDGEFIGLIGHRIREVYAHSTS